MKQREIQVYERPPLLQSLPLSFQHLFAMFGSTVLVPFLFKVDPATILLMNGIGTLFYFFAVQRKNTGLPGLQLCVSLPGIRRFRFESAL